MSRETIYAALFALVSGLPGVAFASRRLKHWSDVAPALQPALFMVQKREQPREQRGLPTHWTFTLDLYLYAHSGADPNAIPAQALNGLIDALEAAPHGLDLGPLEPSLLRRLQTDDGRIACAPGFLVEALASARESAPRTPEVGELLLIGRRHVRSNNSWMHNAPRLVKGKPRHHLEMHPDDLASRGLSDGERVRIRSRVGQVDVEVRASDAVRVGVICLPHGFGHGRPGTRQARASKVEGPSYNGLTDPEFLDGVSGNAAVNGLPVSVSRIAG